MDPSSVPTTKSREPQVVLQDIQTTARFAQSNNDRVLPSQAQYNATPVRVHIPHVTQLPVVNAVPVPRPKHYPLPAGDQVRKRSVRSRSPSPHAGDAALEFGDEPQRSSPERLLPRPTLGRVLSCSALNQQSPDGSTPQCPPPPCTPCSPSSNPPSDRGALIRPLGPTPPPCTPSPTPSQPCSSRGIQPPPCTPCSTPSQPGSSEGAKPGCQPICAQGWAPSHPSSYLPKEAEHGDPRTPPCPREERPSCSRDRRALSPVPQEERAPSPCPQEVRPPCSRGT